MSTLAEIKAAATLSPAEWQQLDDFVRELRLQAEEARLQELYRVTGVHPLPGGATSSSPTKRSTNGASKKML